MNYTKSFDLQGDCGDPMIWLTPKCDYVNCRVVNQRRLDIRGAVTIHANVTGEVTVPIVTDAFGCGIQLKKLLLHTLQNVLPLQSVSH